MLCISIGRTDSAARGRRDRKWEEEDEIDVIAERIGPRRDRIFYLNPL
jgi:hypothetical protein